MTRTEICGAIAEKLEPKPQQQATEYWFDQPSVGGFWEWYGCPASWHALDFFTDEAASARLLDAMLKADPLDGVEIVQNPDGSVTIQFESVFTDGSDRKTAIVLASAKWLGIEVELDESREVKA